MAGPLVGIRVLDLSRVLAGPWLGQLLADLGAEVWKVERPRTGDDTRHWGPPYLKDSSGQNTSESAYYLSANRGKKSICIDIATDDGVNIIRKLASKADVLIENYKVGDLAKRGLGYDKLKELNPKLIYCSITGFGQTGPLKNRAGYDMSIQAIGGLMSLTGERDDLPGGGPQKVGVPIVDLLTGIYSATAVISALFDRTRTDKGQHIDMALLDVLVATLANQNMNFLTTGQAPVRMGNSHPNIVPYQVFATSDGAFVLAVGNDRQFRNFCEIADLAEMAEDPRFSTNAERLKHRDELVTILAERLSHEPTSHWIGVLEAAGVPCAPVNRLDQVFGHPQVLERQMRIDLQNSLGVTVPLVANPIKFSSTKVEYQYAPPLLAEHTGAVLSDVLGLPEAEISRLRSVGAIWDKPNNS